MIMGIKTKIKKYLLLKLTGQIDFGTLIKRGLKVGTNFSMQKECIIDDSHCSLITIGNNVTLAPRVHILAHDSSTKMFLGYTKIGKVTIEDKVFIGAGSIILPNVNIGSNVIIGAGSVVTQSIPNNSVAVGNPCKPIGKTDEYIDKTKQSMESNPVFDETYTLRSKEYTKEKELDMIERIGAGLGYIE